MGTFMDVFDVDMRRGGTENKVHVEGLCGNIDMNRMNMTRRWNIVMGNMMMRVNRCVKMMTMMVVM